jgi:hypothetical protein
VIPIAIIATSSPASNVAPPPEPTPGFPNIVFDDEIVTYTAAQALCNPIGARHQWIPECLWKNGKTVWVWQGSTFAPYYGQVSGMQFDENDGYSGPNIIGRVGPNNDTHNVPSMAIDADGQIWVVQEYPHSTALDVYAVEFTPSFSSVRQAWKIGNNQAYPCLIERGAGYTLWNRQNNLYDAGLIHSPVGFTNWGGQTRVSNSDEAYRHYETLPRNYFVNGYYYLMISRRKESGEGWYESHHVLKTTDFINFSNLEGTYSQNISGSNPIVSTTQLNNYRAWNVPVNMQACIAISCVSPAGDFYLIAGDGLGAYFIRYFYEGAWHSQQIVIANLAIFPVDDVGGQVNAFNHIIAFSHDYIVLFAHDVNGRNRMYSSTDVGVSWIDHGLVFPELSGGEGRIVIPRNIFNIPDNRNFMIGCVDYSQPQGAQWDERGICVKKAAFGTIQ